MHRLDRRHDGRPVHERIHERAVPIDDYIPPTATTCPSPLVFGPAERHAATEAGCRAAARATSCTASTRSSTSSNGGAQNRYVTGSDAIGLTMGYYDTKALPIYQYLHDKKHPDYAIADNFFQAAFGGSFLNHQWLIAAATPVWSGALERRLQRRPALGARRQRDAEQLPALRLAARHDGEGPAADAVVQPGRVAGRRCSRRSCAATTRVNTTQPFFQPYSPGTASTRRLPPLPSTERDDRRRADRTPASTGRGTRAAGQRRRRHDGARLDERERADLLATRTPIRDAAAGPASH